MTNLFNPSRQEIIIHQTYKNQFHQLSPSKQFHYSSRLSLVLSDKWASLQVKALRTWFLGGISMIDQQKRLDNLGQSQPDTTHLNAAQERLPFFEQNPWLFGYELQLFQILHAKTQYELDLVPLLKTSPVNIDNKLQSLIQDPAALAVLSTYLVDVFYLHNRIVLKRNLSLIDIEMIDRALDYNFSPKQKPRLNIYLLTHCIIGETNFYAHEVPQSKKAYYDHIAIKLEDNAQRTWSMLTLDNKLEIALCLLLVHRESALTTKAIEESEAHFDPTLGYITDPTMPHKNDLEWSEHRNVLYLMVRHLHRAKTQPLP